MRIKRIRHTYDVRGRRAGTTYELDRFNISIADAGAGEDCAVFHSPLYRVPIRKLEEIVETYRALRKEKSA